MSCSAWSRRGHPSYRYGHYQPLYQRPLYQRHESYQRPVIIVVLGALSTSRPLVLNSSLALQGHPQCEILVESPNRGLAGMEDSVPRRCDYASDVGAFPVSRAVKCRVDVGACPLPAAASCGVERVVRRRHFHGAHRLTGLHTACSTSTGPGAE